MSHIYKNTYFLSAMVKGLQQIFQAPITNFFLIFIITFNLFLPLGCYVLRKNIDALSNIWNQSAEISLYLKKNVNAKMATNLTEKLKPVNAIMDLKLITSDEGIKDFARYTGFGEMLLGFGRNPLPNVIIVHPKLNESSEKQILALIDSLKNIPEVETVKTNLDWIGSSYRLLNLWEHLSLVFTLLSIGAMIVFGWTVYVMPQIIVNKIETDKRTLQYQCFWHSLIGGLLAVILINFILMLLSSSGLVLQKLGMGYSMEFIFAEVLLTVVISKFALGR